MNSFSIDGCSAAYQATHDQPCWGNLRVYDSFFFEDEGDYFEFWACEGHINGMFIAGDDCDLSRYKPQEKESLDELQK